MPSNPARKQAEALANTVRDDLAELADTDRAEQMAAYMKGHFPFYGIQAKERRQAQRPVVASLAETDGDGVVAFAEACWAMDERELQYVGADALRKHVKLLDAGHLANLEELVTTKSWWDSVDTLAAHSVGPLIAVNPELAVIMDDWIEDDDIWLARTAIIYQLGYKENTDGERLFRYADRRAADTEFFIRKAIGWALRQYGRFEPDAVRDYVASREDKLSGLTKREALKRL
jgi:3-methyladenine DNA glycosylase AlkD